MPTDKSQQYIERIRLDNQRYVDQLQQENERVRALALALQTENTHFRQVVESQLQDIHRFQSERDIYRTHLTRVEAESRRNTEEFADIEARNLNLANLYVASYQLHGTLSRSAVLNSIRDIIVNLVGSEQFGVFEMSQDADFLELVTSVGVDEELFQLIPVATSVVGRCAMSGETVVNPSREDAELAGIVACIPLKLDQRVMGAIAVFRLLPHKPRLEDIDYELFDLLATHAATALYCTALHSRAVVANAETLLGDGRLRGH